MSYLLGLPGLLPSFNWVGERTLQVGMGVMTILAPHFIGFGFVLVQFGCLWLSYLLS